MSASIEDVFRLLDASDAAYIGTTEPDGRPYVSAAGFVSRREGEEIELWFLLSGIARHAKNAASNPGFSALVTESASSLPVFERPRATLLGKAEYPIPGAPASVVSSYQQRYPKSRALFALGDFRFCRLSVDEIHYFAGFGSTVTFRLGER